MRTKKVYGVGINDADYVVELKETLGYDESGRQLRKVIWSCPFYVRWKDMLKRCYNLKFLLKHPSYSECTTVPEWHYFSTFRSWMVEQDWEGKDLDKDILFPGNKVYSPQTCVFVDAKVNRFLLERQKLRGEFPIGVSYHMKDNNYMGRCRDIVSGKQKYLGSYETPEEAHQAWLTFKLDQAKILASQQADPRVAKALIDRYENYTDQPC